MHKSSAKMAARTEGGGAGIMPLSSPPSPCAHSADYDHDPPVDVTALTVVQCWREK